MNPKPRKTALLLVSDKTGIVDFAVRLSELGYDLVSAGSTAKTLKQAELRVEEVSLVPFDPNLLLRIVTDPSDPMSKRRLEDMDLTPIDLVVVNLYPVAETLAGGTLMTQPEFMEYVDIVPSALLRAAARSFTHVIPLCEPLDYGKILDGIAEFGDLDREVRQGLAAKAFFYTAYYDSTVAQFLAEKPDLLPDELVIGLKKNRDLRYGENPHQKAALYSVSGARAWGISASRQVHGKDLNFNHYLDLEAAVELVGEFSEPACAIVKHAQPCGAATSERLADALKQAFRSDPVSATRGVAALNWEVDEETARHLAELQLECVAAPDFSQKAMELLRLKKELRLVTVASTLLSAYEMSLYPVSGGLLVQHKDNQTIGELKAVTQRAPNPSQLVSLTFAWKVAKHAKSCAVVLAKGTQAVGIGAGQSSRLDALRLAVDKSNERHPILRPQDPLVLASDGPLPLHCLHEAAAIGVAAIIQPGGTSEDHASIQLCDQQGMAMAFTGLRHLKH